MISLARTSLLYDWRRYVSAVLALAFATLLIHVQIGITLAWFLMQAVFLKNTTADILISSPNAKAYEQSYGLNKGQELLVRMHPEIASVQVQRTVGGMIKGNIPEEKRSTCTINVVNRTDDGELFMPREFVLEFGGKLQEPLAVALDESCRSKLGLNVGDSFEVGGKRVKLAGVASGYKGTQLWGRNQFIGFASPATADLLANRQGWSNISYLLIKLKDPSKAELVRDQLNAEYKGKIRAWTKDELFWASQRYHILEDKANMQIIFSAILSALIGIVITNQSLRSAILASMRDYAAIRALGVSRASLSLVVMEQAFWVGATGLAAGLLLTWAVDCNSEAFGIFIKIPNWLPFATAPFIIGVALLSGLLSLMVLYRTQPAELLR